MHTPVFDHPSEEGTGAAANFQFSIFNSQFSILKSDDYPAIVDWCFNVTSPGKICLLSPAAASYDSFKNFEQRGDTFKQLVRQHS
jgi:UDP-N-acetylmuramoylalanine--D-glutamate ligase